MMARKTLLFIGADQLHAWLWNRGKLSSMQSFINDAEGLQQFSAFLQGNRDPAYLLADLGEEDYRLETLPHLRGHDRSSLIQRKLGQFYRNTPFRQAILQQRRHDGRRDDEVLFSALINPSHISPWLDILLASQTAIAGIHSISGISTPLAATISSRYVLLVSWEKHGGLRQTYFDNKLLRFSRLTAIHQGSSFGENITEEVERTRQYLKSLSLLPQDQKLEVRVICHDDERHELKARLADGTVLRYSCLSLQEFDKRPKPGPNFANSDATPLFLHLLASRRYKDHYASPAHTYYFRLAQLRRGLNVLSTILLAGSLPWSAANVMEGCGLISDSTSINAGTQQLVLRTGQIMRGSPGSPGTANDMKSAVLLVRRLADASPAPQEMLNELSMTLNDFPDIRVVKLDWHTEAATHAARSEASATQTPDQEITLTGELEPAGAADPDAPGYVDGFRQALIAQGLYATIISPLPDTGFERSGALPLSPRIMLKINWRSTP